MVNYSNCTRNELISVCKSRNIKNISNKKKEELIKIVKKGGYNSTKLKRFEKLLLILYGINSNKYKSIDIKLDYREIIYLILIRLVLNNSKNIEEYDDISKNFYNKIDEIEDHEVKLFIYFFVKTNLKKKEYNTHTLNVPSLISGNKKLEFSNEFNNISSLKENRDEIYKFFDKLSKLTDDQKEFFKEIYYIFVTKNVKKLNLKKYELENFNFNIGMLTPFNLSIYGNFQDKFIEQMDDKLVNDLINFKPKTDELSLNSLGFAIFVGNYQAVEYLLKKGADFRNVFDSRSMKNSFFSSKYSPDAITFSLLLYYSLIEEGDSSIILSRLIYYQPIKSNNQNINKQKHKINFIKEVINLILPKFEEKSNVNLLGYKDGYTARTLLKKSFKNTKSFDILEKLKIIKNLPQEVKNNITNFYNKIKNQKKKIKENKFMVKKIQKILPFGSEKKSNSNNKIERLEERNSLLSSVHKEQSGGGLSLDIGISFGLLASGALGLVFGCTLATFGLCFIIVLSVTLTSVIAYTGYKGYKYQKKLYINNIDKYLDNNMDIESSNYLKNITLNDLNIDNGIKILKTLNNENSKISKNSFLRKFVINYQLNIDLESDIMLKISKILPKIHNSLIIKDTAIEYLKKKKSDYILNIFNNGKIFPNDKKGFLVTKARVPVVQQGRMYDFYLSMYLYIKSIVLNKKNPLSINCYLIFNNKYFDKSILDYNKKLYNDMKLFLRNNNILNKNLTKNESIKFNQEVNLKINELITWYNNTVLKPNYKNIKTHNDLRLILNRNINSKFFIFLTDDQFKKIYNILLNEPNNLQRLENIRIVIYDELLIKKKLITTFVQYFIKNNINNNNLISNEYKYYITEFDVKNNKKSNEFLLDKYSDLREKSVTYFYWSNILYFLYKDQKMGLIEFIIKYNIGEMYYKKVEIKFENVNNINNLKGLYIIDNWFDENLQSKNKQDVKTFKIYTDLDLAIKKNLELKIIDYYINLIENRNE